MTGLGKEQMSTFVVTIRVTGETDPASATETVSQRVSEQLPGGDLTYYVTVEDLIEPSSGHEDNMYVPIRIWAAHPTYRYGDLMYEIATRLEVPPTQIQQRTWGADHA